ncbi:oxidoreductase [Streptomyces sp. AK02-01A]|uniref:oxidoreductase n=1 Tax=Streptomyces sp. AK02-01A TaxID=3028648 RepID=UPI0029A2FF11|nr:oxidoreductase [Streptomyces sp. AK02-01A]MDX3853211.1 oxidoreductase [Streptomyces sp. AK02-01A]
MTTSTRTTSWTLTDLPPQRGRTVLVTGAGGGIGLETARALASAGARVVLAVRDVDTARQAADRIGGSTEVLRLDLADLSSVRRFAAAWDRPLDILVNNAGVANVPLLRTRDGFEPHFGTNHLGHFALTNLLLPRITGRVVTVASNAHRRASLDLDDLNWERRPYRAAAAYGQSKLANLLFTRELQRRLTASGSALRAVAAHPGAATTGLNRHLGPVMTLVAATVGRLVMQSGPAGALPTLFAATEDIPGASYAGPDGRGEQRGHPTLVGRSSAAEDDALARELWDRSEDLTGTAYPLPLP